MKNERTPRTLADCQWTTGYSSAEPPRGLTTAERVMLWMAGACFLVWGLEYAAAWIFGN